jgi:hypothetical protein
LNFTSVNFPRYIILVAAVRLPGYD